MALRGAMSFGANISEGLNPMPRGPIVVWIVRVIPDRARENFKDKGYDFREGRAYIWRTTGHAPFDWNALKDVRYLCDFDVSLSDDQLAKAFLKHDTSASEKETSPPRPK